MTDSNLSAVPRRASKIAEREDVGALLIRRWLGCWIDLIAVAIIFFTPFGLASALLGPGTPEAVAGITGVLLALAYYPVAETLWGQTLGKLITGLIVVTDDGRKPNFGRSLLRTLLRLVEVNPFLMGGIPAGVVVLISKSRQRLGDMAAGTYVIPKSQLGRITPPAEQQAIVFD